MDHPGGWNVKTQWLDYVLSTVLLTVLSALALGLAGLGSFWLTRPLLGPYFPIADLALALLGFGLGAALAGHIVIRRSGLGPGDYAMDSPVFTAWKLYTVSYEFGCSALRPFTSMFARPLVAKLFGATVGRDIALGGTLVDAHLIRIGDEAIIGQGSVVTAHAIVSGRIILKPVDIRRGATVGVNAVVMPGVVVGERAIVAGGSVVAMDTTIPPDELWGGTPARRIKSLVSGNA